jgi:5-methylcytosine-specific restriction endonuclease McrA
LPPTDVKFNLRNIFARDKNRCQYCGKRYPTSELSLDHVIPRTTRHNPLIHVHLGQERYRSWQQFLDHAYWSVELK